jgi:hypothetical protein
MTTANYRNETMPFIGIAPPMGNAMNRFFAQGAENRHLPHESYSVNARPKVTNCMDSLMK